MGWIVRVQLKGAKSEIRSPEFESRDAAESDLAKIRDTLATGNKPDVTWMTAQGMDILGASIEQAGGPLRLA